MAVSSYIISELFPNKEAQKLQSRKSRFPIVYATIYNPLIRIKENAVYIVIDPEDFPTDVDDVASAFIVIGNPDSDALNETRHDVICLSKDCELGKIYESVVDLLERYSDWDEEVNNILVKDGAVDDLCRVSLPILKKPFLIAMSDFKVMAVGDETGSFSKSAVSESGFLREHRIVEMVRANEIDNEDQTFHFSLISEKKASTFLVTMECGQQVGWYICMDNVSESFSDGDITRLSIFGHYLERYLKYSPSEGGIALNNLKNGLYEYLFAKSVRQVQFQSALSGYGWESGDEYLCCVMKLKSQQNERNILNYLCGYIGHHLDGAAAIRENRAIFMLCDLSRCSADRKKRIAEIVRISKDFGMSAGISSAFFDSAYIRDYFNQARAVLAFCEGRSEKSAVYCFDDCRLEYLLKKGYSSLPISALLTPKLYSFLLEDSGTNFENYKILRSYIRNNLNITDTIAELYLHRSSFTYRLDKIKKMLETELNDKDELLYFNIISYAIDESFHIDDNSYDPCKTGLVKNDEIMSVFPRKSGKGIKAIETGAAV